MRKVALCVGGLIVSASSAFAQVTLPDVGVDMTELLPAGIQSIGAVALIAVGAALAFMVVKTGIVWARKGFKG